MGYTLVQSLMWSFLEPTELGDCILPSSRFVQLTDAISFLTIRTLAVCAYTVHKIASLIRITAFITLQLLHHTMDVIQVSVLIFFGCIPY